MRDYQFGEFIYKLRTERKLSQSKLGELVGVSNKAVSKWENGVSKPSMDTLKKLAAVFNLSIEELLNGIRASESVIDQELSCAETDDIKNEANEEKEAKTEGEDEADTVEAPTAQNEEHENQDCDVENGSQSNDPPRKRKMIIYAIIAVALLISVTAAILSLHYHNARQDNSENSTSEPRQDTSDEPYETTSDESFGEMTEETTVETTEEPSNETQENETSETTEENTELPDLKTIKRSVVKIETNLGSGSGFCVIKDNWIITNYHVIKNAKKINIIDDNNQKTEISDIVLYDEEKDIAVLEADIKLPPLTLGDGNALNLMDEITVIGSPEGVLNTVSVGIISNTSHEEYIVISAPISPGSSGGVMLNDKFQAIGIITATANDEFAQNLNFAINIEKLKEIHENYKKGEFKTLDYPPIHSLLPDVNVTPTVPPTQTEQPKEVPYYLITYGLEYVASEKLYRLDFSVGSNYGHSMAADIDIGFVIKNSENVVVYDGKKSLTAADFFTDNTFVEASVELPVSEITAGTIAFGSAEVILIYDGKKIDSVQLDIERGLPTLNVPFETLIFSGNGVGSATGIDLPYGTYNVIFTYSGMGMFEAELNGRNIVRKYYTINGTNSYVYQIKPQEDSHYYGTPLKNAVFNIKSADGPWTLTIERANTSDEGREYTDGQTYSGSGTGYAKDIYLPYGTYNITITHSGSSCFEIELDGRSIHSQVGKTSYIYTLKPDEEMHYSGTPMLAAYFNIVEADGDWSITIHKIE